MILSIWGGSAHSQRTVIFLWVGISGMPADLNSGVLSQTLRNVVLDDPDGFACSSASSGALLTLSPYRYAVSSKCLDEFGSTWITSSNGLNSGHPPIVDLANHGF